LDQQAQTRQIQQIMAKSRAQAQRTVQVFAQLFNQISDVEIYHSIWMNYIITQSFIPFSKDWFVPFYQNEIALERVE
jgi:hypothetical protein